MNEIIKDLAVEEFALFTRIFNDSINRTILTIEEIISIDSVSLEYKQNLIEQHEKDLENKRNLMRKVFGL